MTPVLIIFNSIDVTMKTKPLEMFHLVQDSFVYYFCHEFQFFKENKLCFSYFLIDG